jgi:hypothetical protein
MSAAKQILTVFEHTVGLDVRWQSVAICQARRGECVYTACTTVKIYAARPKWIPVLMETSLSEVLAAFSTNFSRYT